MLTQFEKNCYKEKLNFIKNLNKLFAHQTYSGISVVGVSLEFYEQPSSGRIVEYIVVEYKGGAYAPCIATANSNSANFRLVSKVINGGYYEEKDTYDDIKKSWKNINKEILKKEKKIYE
jgi:hypothetical protein